MKRTPLGTPLIWFKAPTSLLPHGGTIEIAFPEHQTHFELELGVVIGARAKNVSVGDALAHVCGFTIGEDISDRDLQTSEKQFGRAKSFDTSRQWGRLFTPTWMSRICRSRSGKTAKSGSKRAPAR